MTKKDLPLANAAARPQMSPEEYEKWKLSVKTAQDIKKRDEEAALAKKVEQDKSEEAVKDRLLSLCHEILSSIDPEQLATASLREKSAAFNVFYDKYRLANNKATINVNVNNLSGMIASVSGRKIELEEEVKEVVVEVADDLTEQ